MTKLKTLKDLPHYNFEGVPMKNGVAIDERNLKAEAVKWANKTGVSMTAIEFIEQFFNITEEDLK